MAQDNRDAATEPGALAQLFNQRANAGDVEGLVALYEPGAVLAAGLDLPRSFGLHLASPTSRPPRRSSPCATAISP